MFETLFSHFCQHAEWAHLAIFGLLLLSGLNVPISEDLLLLTGGAIVAKCIPGHYFWVYGWVFFGSWISAWEAYGIGRIVGPRLYDIPWFSYVLTPKRIELLHGYYEKYGVWTFVVGRFMPGGVRNALFLTSGLGKMPFLRFILRDVFACLLYTSIIFYVGFKFGQNFPWLVKTFSHYSLLLLGLIVMVASLLLIYYNRRK